MKQIDLYQLQRGRCSKCPKALYELGNLHDGELLCQLCYHPIHREKYWDEERNEPKWDGKGKSPYEV